MTNRLARPNPLALGLAALVASTASWAAVAHPEQATAFVWLLCGLAGLFYFAPLGYRHGRAGAGAAAALFAVLLGPISFLLLVPWAVAVEREE